MCGIAGFTKNRKVGGDVLEKITTALKHRGPDDFGYFENEHIALGHRRLSIIDLSGGHQPMTEADYTIIFNGEIYNYQSLKSQLESEGHVFKTTSDTEVLLKMFSKHQEQCLDLLDGMFGFAIWDNKKQELFLARDRLGVKPLYYSLIGDNLIFASEIKAILAYPDCRRKLNTKVLNSYFQYRYIIGDETFFEGIFSLKPGCYLKYNSASNKLSTKQYWELPRIANKQDKGETFYLSEVERLVKNSIKHRMISDVPIGAYLSGGLDSSIISAVMASLRSLPKLETFIIGFKEKGFNEFPYARQVAELWHTNHHEINLSTEDYLQTMDELIGFKDAPLAVPNEVPLYLMSKELKKHITVVLSGEGADELFGGYGKIFNAYMDFEGTAEQYLSHFLTKYNYVSDADLDKFFSDKVLDDIRNHTYTYQFFQKQFDQIKHLDIRDRIMYIFQTVHLLGLLHRVDTTTMAASVEARVPFVDDKNLVEFVNEIPFEYKIRWNSDKAKHEAKAKSLTPMEISEIYDTTKYIFRKSFDPYLPPEVVNRKKMGFPVPLDKWIIGDSKLFFKSILEDQRTLNRGIYNQTYLMSGKYLEELNGMNIWMMVNLELFLRKYFD